MGKRITQERGDARRYGLPDVVDVLVNCFFGYMSSPEKTRAKFSEWVPERLYEVGLDGVAAPIVDSHGFQKVVAFVVTQYLASNGTDLDAEARERVCEAASFAEFACWKVFGGRTVRIPKGPSSFARRQAVAHGHLLALKLGSPIDYTEIFKAAGVSRATGFRILGSKKLAQ